MNTANKITLLRVILIPVFVVVSYSGLPHAGYWALGIFIFASATDWVDGYIARHCNQITDFGKFMDPLADKLLVMAAVLVFVERGQLPAWVALVVIAREFAVTALRLVAVDGGRVIAAGVSGKVKTASSLVCLSVMMTPLTEIPLGGFTLNTLAVAVILVTTVWSGTEYFIRNRDVLGGRT
ncbi:CDP-diacylglycerol--glycerol-3-phosphate 3-phosphatidyltransferase [Papillibacter cinnamivorans]|uniref:CDP-diacylglycerol--glycerol-3-phosphate 3-phosphatidyltransferase n=1 Tax=Papillibacter cinnamivorans DSM 12816 TaxID=1122930 RepID=A0A1W1ZJ06_9FIRM|nr:CDP-diacylglycerol--glycerol-3-phosphate 3-phosphatidyltransferase [Papillibacter cinnamivorans]SMC48192.1 CDP-diacylglycerol--glycerol-3-phosphate 3-phosphatidyltransferase [Papillibacter cinnamivorans DSM 12816]